MSGLPPRFCEYVLLREDDRRTGAKTGLYPLGASGVGLYPDADYLTHAADAILYLTQDKRLYNNGDNPPFDIRHLPGHKQYGDDINNGDGDPFPLGDLPGKPVPPKDSSVPGRPVPFKSFVRLVQHPKTISPKAVSMPK